MVKLKLVLIIPSVVFKVFKGIVIVEPTCPTFGGKIIIPSIKKVATIDKPLFDSIGNGPAEDVLKVGVVPN